MSLSRSRRDKNNPNWRDKYRNPSPPPGYVKPHSRIVLKGSCQPIESINLKFLQLTIESGIFDESDPEEFPIPPSDEEVVSLSVQTKVIELIDLEPDSPVSLEVECVSPPLPPPDVEPPPLPPPDELPPLPVLPPPEALPLPNNSSSKEQPSKHQKKHKEIIIEACGSSDSSSSHHHHSRMKKKKQRRERRTISLSPPKRRRSRSRSPKRERSRSRSPMYSDHKRRSEYKKSDDIYDDKYTRSPTKPEHDLDFNDAYVKQEFILKQESIKQEYPNQAIGNYNLFGSYFCEYCKSGMNSEGTWISHINGKKHLKALKLVNTAKTIADSLATTTQMSSRCRPAPPNTYRVKTNEIADAQIVIESKLRTPCPGLEKVIEIHGLVETHYYCELCDAPCAMNSILPHLQGFKHQLNCLKLFDREAYENYHLKKKGEIEYKVTKILREVEKKNGMGNVVVEREFKSDADQSAHSSLRDRKHRRADLPGPSRSPVETFPESYAKSIEPDTSKSDFYCKLCDSHMNNRAMWEQHIRGKRHLANLKKRPGEAPSKTRSIRVPDARAIIMDEIDQLDVPVVGLNQIRETQNPETNGSQYNCFLCGACMTHLDVVDHVLCLKHKSKYLEHIKNKAYMVLKDMGMGEKQMQNVIEENCYYVYQEEGPGEVEVHVTKNAVTVW